MAGTGLRAAPTAMHVLALRQASRNSCLRSWLPGFLISHANCSSEAANGNVASRGTSVVIVDPAATILTTTVRTVGHEPGVVFPEPGFVARVVHEER